MLKMLGRVSIASALVLVGTSSLFAQGSFILGVDEWTDYGAVADVPGTWSGVTVTETEPNDDYLTANPIAVGDDFAGAIATGGTETDYVAFTVAVNDSIIAETVDAGGIADTKLWLYDTDGVTQLAYNDDGGAGLFSLISYTFTTAGTYYLQVGPYSTSHEGAYGLELRGVAGQGPTGSWIYIQKALESIAPGVTRTGADGSVAVLGAADSTAIQYDAGAAYHYVVPVAAANTNLTGTVNFYDTDTVMATFFTDLAAGIVNPSIVVFSGSGSGNDMDALECAELVNNAATISAYLASGGGLIAHGDSAFGVEGTYDWLPFVFPGAGVVQGSVTPTLTNEGRFYLPGWEDADHYTYGDGYFTGLTGVDVYMTIPASGPVTGPWSGVTINETEPNDDYLTANAIAVGDDYAGDINPAAESDYAAVTVTAGTRVAFETVDIGGLNDTKLYLYDTDGVTQIAYDDDGGVGLKSLIDYTFTAPGTYYIAVVPYSSTLTGLYSLQVRTATDGLEDPCVVGSLPSAWAWLGNDLGGINGKPLMVPTGTLAPASPWTLSLTDAAPSTTAFLITGLSTVYLPIKGGVLVPANHVLVPLPTNASGELAFGGVLGAPPSGATFYMQYWIIDAAGPFGFSASNGLSGTTP